MSCAGCGLCRRLDARGDEWGRYRSTRRCSLKDTAGSEKENRYWARSLGAVSAAHIDAQPFGPAAPDLGLFLRSALVVVP